MFTKPVCWSNQSPPVLLVSLPKKLVDFQFKTQIPKFMDSKFKYQNLMNENR
jgi:hypothetical protein